MNPTVIDTTTTAPGDPLYFPGRTDAEIHRANVPVVLGPQVTA